MTITFECTGQPRNMGSDQGRALAPRIAAAVRGVGLPVRRSRRANLRAYAAGPTRGRGDGRELIRHFTHLSERIDGLSRFADVDVDSLFELHLRAARASSGDHALSAPASAVAGIGLGGATGVGMLRGLPARVAGADWCVRRSAPEVGFASLEVTLPWLVTSVAGVNAAGVCAALAPLRGRPEGPAAAPSHLLVQECLQRFEDVAGCIDWCLKRPVLGDTTLVLADARGVTATVDLKGRARHVDLHEKASVGANAAGPLEHPGAEDAERGLDSSADLLVALDAERRVLDLRAVGARTDRLTLSV